MLHAPTFYVRLSCAAVRLRLRILALLKGPRRPQQYPGCPWPPEGATWLVRWVSLVDKKILCLNYHHHQLSRQCQERRKQENWQWYPIDFMCDSE